MNSLSPLFRHRYLRFLPRCVSPQCTQKAAIRTKSISATASGSPFTFLDINNIQGVMVGPWPRPWARLATASRMNKTNFAALIYPSTSGKLDFIAAGMLKTEERTKVVDFSNSGVCLEK